MVKNIKNKLKKLGQKRFLILFALFCLLFPLTVKAFSLLGMLREIWDLVKEFLLAFCIIAFAIIFISYFALSLASLAIVVFSWIIRITTEVPIVDSWARDIGWTFTRNLVNMLFIIILAWIGIATILRLREYRTGKIFIKLLVIALLVNFSPVLIGLVVDFSNIIIGYFVSGITQGSVLECILVPCKSAASIYTGGFIQVAAEGLWSAFGEAFNPLSISVKNRLLALGTVAGYGIFFFVVTCVFGLLALLYLFRIIAFWVLLILAPIAFICYILPRTEKFWWMWWHQLTQWAFVGIVAIFFVWLAFGLLQATAENPTVRGMFGTVPQGVQNCPDPSRCPPNAPPPNPAACQGPNPPAECFCNALTCQVSRIEGVDIASGKTYSAFTEAFINILNSLLPLAVITVFLFIGLFFGFTSSAMGASAIVIWGKRKGKAWGLAAWQKGKRTVQRRMPERVRRRLESWGTAPSLRERLKAQPTLGGKLREVTRAPLTWGKRRIGRLGIGATEAQVQEIKKLEAEFGKIETLEKMKEKIRTGSINQRIAALRAAIDKGWLEDLKLSDAEKVRLTQEAARIYPELAKKIIKASPQLAAEVARELTPEIRRRAGLALPEDLEERERELRRFFTEEELRKFAEERTPEEVITRQYLSRKITAGLSPSDIAKMDWRGLSATLREAKEAREAGVSLTAEQEAALQVEEAIHRFWSGREIGAAAREFGMEFVDTFMEEASRRGADWYVLRNQKVLRYLRSTAAEELGFRMPPGRTLSEEEIEGILSGAAPKAKVPEKPKIEVPPEKAPRRYTKKYGEEEKGPEEEETL